MGFPLGNAVHLLGSYLYLVLQTILTIVRNLRVKFAWTSKKVWVILASIFKHSLTNSNNTEKEMCADSCYHSLSVSMQHTTLFLPSSIPPDNFLFLKLKMCLLIQRIYVAPWENHFKNETRLCFKIQLQISWNSINEF